MQKTSVQAGREVGIGEISIIMKKVYRDYNQNRPVSMLSSLRRWLPEWRLPFFMSDIIHADPRIGRNGIEEQS
ncbi:MAG: hypothetical protein ACOX4K_05565 [Bacillota bacterium]